MIKIAGSITLRLNTDEVDFTEDLVKKGISKISIYRRGLEGYRRDILDEKTEVDKAEK